MNVAYQGVTWWCAKGILHLPRSVLERQLHISRSMVNPWYACNGGCRKTCWVEGWVLRVQGEENPRSANVVEEGETSQLPAPLLVVALQLCMPCIVARKGSALGSNWVCWA